MSNQEKALALFDSIKRLFGAAPKAAPAPIRRPSPPIEPDPEPEVAELSAADLMAELEVGTDLLLLDCRENYERQMAHIPHDLHIPMDELPRRLDELEAAIGGKSRPVVVYCASGMRSFGVTHYLTENGFNARNLSGGLTRWQMARGPIERG
jgi:rhodanese-related sulfurtransferase